jgi:sulfur-oxidizing protein SoxY
MKTIFSTTRYSRRDALKAGSALAVSVMPAFAIAQSATSSAPLSAPSASVSAASGEDVLARAVRAYVGEAAWPNVREGRVALSIAPLVDNGNSVSVDVSVESPMTAEDHVVTIALFNEKNPQREVMECLLTPQMGRAAISARIRLAMTQRVVAVAKMRDGRCFTHTVNVVVTLAACIEGDEI